MSDAIICDVCKKIVYQDKDNGIFFGFFDLNVNKSLCYESRNELKEKEEIIATTHVKEHICFDCYLKFISKEME